MKNLKELGFSNYSITSDGHVYSRHSKRFLKRCVGSDGYCKQTLVDDKGSVKYLRNCRLVGLMFCEGYEEGLVVNHKDGNKLNDNFTNLEWTTVQGNSHHAIENELQVQVGGKEMLSIPKVHEVCKMLEEGYRKKEICEITGVSVRSITEILNGTYWEFISKEYSINYVKKKSRISLEKVLRICQDLESGATLTETANKNSVGTSTVHRIKKRQVYSDISKNFHW